MKRGAVSDDESSPYRKPVNKPGLGWLMRLVIAAVAIALLAASVSETAAAKVPSGLKTGGPSIVWPPPPQKARIQYVGSIQGARDLGRPRGFFRRVVRAVIGRSPQRLVKPYGVASDGSGLVVVTDCGRCSVHVFDFENSRATEIVAFKGQGFVSPIGVALGEGSNIYVTDSVLKKVLLFDRDGRFLLDVGKDWAFARPTGIAFDASERKLFVTDTLNSAVVVLSADGAYLYHFGLKGGEKGELYFPTNIFLAGDGLLYVSDSMNFRIQIFRKDGTFVSSLGKLGDGSGDLARPRGVAVDSAGHIYVVDGWFDVVQIFGKAGEYFLGFGEPGSGPAQFWLPAGIWIDSSDTIYVADSYNRRVQVFQYVGGAEP